MVLTPEERLQSLGLNYLLYDPHSVETTLDVYATEIYCSLLVKVWTNTTENWGEI